MRSSNEQSETEKKKPTARFSWLTSVAFMCRNIKAPRWGWCQNPKLSALIGAWGEMYTNDEGGKHHGQDIGALKYPGVMMNCSVPPAPFIFQTRGRSSSV